MGNKIKPPFVKIGQKSTENVGINKMDGISNKNSIVNREQEQTHTF